MSCLALGTLSSLFVSVRPSTRLENFGGEKVYFGTTFETLGLERGSQNNGSFQVVALCAAADVVQERMNASSPVSTLKKVYLEKVVFALKGEFKYKEVPPIVGMVILKI